jgi:hypothetical protein
MFGAKANIQGQLKALGIPYAVFYIGPFADYIWVSYALCLLWVLQSTYPQAQRFLDLDVTSGKVSVGGDGNSTYVLTHLPPDQLKNCSFTIAGDNNVNLT